MLETRVVITLFVEHLAKCKFYKDEIRQKKPGLSLSYVGTVPHIFPAHKITRADDKNGKQPHPMLEKLG